MSRFRKTKTVLGVLDYEFDWSTKNWLATGEEIATSSWTATTGITVDSDSETTTVTKVWLSGGTLGETYKVTNSITTNNSPSREETRSFFVTIV